LGGVTALLLVTNRLTNGQGPRRPISLLNDDGELQMDEQLKSRFEHVLQHYADIIKERDAALLREKMDREQFEASFRGAVDSVILPAPLR
jgi:capsule polysaccharide export protein KpsC/LpsZ